MKPAGASLRAGTIRNFRCWMLSALILLPGPALAQGWAFAKGGAGWQDFALGFFSGIAAHETGHVLVATSKGYPVSHDGLSLTYPGVHFTRAGQLQLASAGFQTQWLLSEMELRNKDGSEHTRPPSDFGAGVVSSYLGVSFAYLTFLKNQYNGDVYGISRATGMSHDRVAMLAAIPAVLDAWRLFGDDVPKWVPALSVASKGLAATWIWTY
jgi:hypothetical protein